METLACPDYGAQGLNHPSAPPLPEPCLSLPCSPCLFLGDHPTPVSVCLCEEPPVLVGFWKTLREVVDELGDFIRAR